MSNGIDNNGQYINGLPGTQVNPFNDPPGEEGYSDIYHEFEGGDNNAICIAFIDEASSHYTATNVGYQATDPLCADYCPDAAAGCTFDIQDGNIGPGSSLQTPANNNHWDYSNMSSGYSYNKSTVKWTLDLINFSSTWKNGWDLTEGTTDYILTEPNGNGVGSYEVGNFSGILFPTQLGGSSTIASANSALIRLAYATIGQGFNVSDAGIIPVDSFEDLPYAASAFQGCNSPDFFSMKRLTDSNIVGANCIITDPNYPDSSIDKKLTDNTQSVSPGHYMSQGKSLSRYGVQFRLPGGEVSLTQAGPQEIFEA